MTDLLTAAQMRAIEQSAIESGEVTGLELMERAGQGVVEAIFEEWPELAETSHKAVVLCGPGNNGGDGFVVARLLRERGWEVEVFFYGDDEKLSPDAQLNFERWCGMGEVIDIFALSAPGDRGALMEAIDPDQDQPHVLVDAIFGTGQSREIPSDLSDVLYAVTKGRGANGSKVVAVDVPTGLSGDTGRNFGGFEVDADLAVTFHSTKIGHHISNGPAICTKVVVKDIGLNPSAARRILRKPPKPGKRGPDFSEIARLATEDHLGPGFSDKKSRLDKGWVDHTSHKYTHGHALILAGPPGRGGAARLAARGALRIGAGLVAVACALRAEYEHASQLNAIMLRPIDGAPGLKEALEDDRINALCLGPGMGLGTDTMHLVKTALEAERATVLDADALTIFQRQPDALFEMAHDKVVLTPHAGEFARLFPDIAGRLDEPATKGPAYSKVDATRDAAARAGCTILFKGPDTVIADPEGRASINSAHYERSAPWLATAGSGDVLAGFITGLLARGFAPMQAAETAAWLHVEAALSFGPGLIAEDLPEELPKVFRNLGL